MSRYWSPVVHKLDPYVPGEQPKDQRYIKLNTNESPYPPSPLALAAIQTAGGELLRLYPDPNGEVLKDAVAAFFGLERGNVFVGNGSDEVLAHVFQAFFRQGEPVLFPDISYSFYPVYAGLYQIEARTVPLREDFRLVLDDYPSENGGIIFPNPNAPTGMALSRREIEVLLQRNRDSVVVVDEAYVDFGAETVVPLITRYPNLLVVQTLSKSRALAGLRVGFAVGDAALIEGLERVKNSFNSYPLGRMALAAAAAAVADRAYLEQLCERVAHTRTTACTGLEQLGFRLLPSSANFIFARPPQGDAAAFYQALRARGILVRHFSKPRIREYLRITIGTDAEIAALLAACEAILAREVR
ncbi:MAG: histidinol-phosphate transaminase [Thiothrix sp.]|nr:histidinol-phosphate transaminase [Thiothrix sp.]HPQ95379.1 histidinol-phosphate transaminase [Thiolinea sp.]